MITVIKSGKLANGAERDKGKIVHLAKHLGFEKALCGAKPGKRSAMGFIQTEMELNCSKCQNKLIKIIEE